MNANIGHRPKGQIGLIAILGVATVVVVALVLFAVSHLAAKGPGDLPSATEVATGQTGPTRDAYTLQDYTEPNSK